MAYTTHSGIEVRRLDGSEANLISEADDFYATYSWAPHDGQLILSKRVSDSGERSLFLVNSDGTPEVPVRSSSWDPGSCAPECPEWSPDGSEVLYSRSPSYGGFGIYAMPISGGAEELVVGGPFEDRSALWSPDGEDIAFLRSVVVSGDKEQDILVTDRDGGRPTNLTNSPERIETAFSWSPDGSRLSFVATHFPKRRFSVGTLWVMRSDGTRLKRLARGSSDIDFRSAPSWSPDGRKLVFTSERDVTTINADGSGMKRLINLPYDKSSFGAVWATPGSCDASGR